MKQIRFARWHDLSTPVLLVLAGVLVYANSLSGPFVFDDVDAIAGNPTIQHVWPPWSALQTPLFRTTTGRPVANLTLAVNYALGGYNPRGYHVANLLIHLGAGLALFGIVRRTLQRPSLAPRFAAASSSLALAVALAWLVHPLQTESVTYVIQRVESLMGLFYLLTVYCFIRACEGPRSHQWLSASVGCCLLGMGTKEVMVSAPIFVLLYDRTLVAGSFREAWRARRGFYLALATTWLLLLVLVLGSGNRGGSAGFGTEVVWWHYSLYQCRAIAHYLSLALWPHPLIFDYGTEVVRRPVEVLPQALLLLATAGVAGFALWRKSAWGLLGFWFFAILAPSSSVVPVVTQSMAEHRMYLPLAAVLFSLVVALYLWIGRRSFVPVLLVTGGFAVLTIQRNRDYRTEESIWRDTIEKNPGNPRPHGALGNAFADAGKFDQAVVEFRRAIELEPKYFDAYNNLGAMQHKLAQPEAALASYRRAIELNPRYSAAYFNLATLLVELGRTDEARAQFEAVLRLKPDEPNTHFHLANLELSVGHTADAETHYRAALRDLPELIMARLNLGTILAQSGRLSEAKEQLLLMVKSAPDFALAHYNLANVLAQTGDLAAATGAYRRAVVLDPKMTEAHFNLGNTLARQGFFTAAITEYDEVLRLNPNHPRAAINRSEAEKEAILAGQAPAR